MRKDKYITEVVFRKDTTRDFKGTIFALFPNECVTKDGLVSTYQHIGQHSSADYSYCISKSVPATAEEYKDLKSELESIGYNLRIIKRRNYSKFLESYQQVRKR